jgi:MoxR-like ATPase
MLLTPTIDATALLDRLRARLHEAVVVRDETVELLLIALLSRGHVLLEDEPGMGKTLLSRTLAAALGGTFKRIQFTPDLLPADIVGGSVYSPRTGDFDFRPGPVFANVVLADEINRGTPRTQSALLEAMGEGHVSIDGVTHPLERAFCVIATQNPAEQHGTFPLPEAELDRFLVRLRLGRPDAEQLQEILRRHEHHDPVPEGEPVLELPDLIALQDQATRVHVAAPARAYVGDIVLATREHPSVGHPASTRAMVAILRCAQSCALRTGRDHVTADDVKRVAPAVLGHRLGGVGRSGEDLVRSILTDLPIPELG